MYCSSAPGGGGVAAANDKADTCAKSFHQTKHVSASDTVPPPPVVRSTVEGVPYVREKTDRRKPFGSNHYEKTERLHRFLVVPTMRL